jgi:uncharacterized protein YbjT (DUF2867 family)
MRLLVTGGSGFAGEYVLREAARRGHEAVALARSVAAARAVSDCGARPVSGDLDQADALTAVFAAARCDALVNLASLGFGHAPAIIAATEQAGIGRAVFVSTTSVTTTLPAPSKRIRLAAERQIRYSQLQWTIIRPTMIYGAARDRNLSRLLRLLSRTRLFPVPGGGRHLQQPVHVTDVADAVLNAVERPPTAGLTYDVAGPSPMTFVELLRACAQAVASRARFVPVPLMPVIALASGYERISQHPLIRAEQLRRLAEDKAFAIEAAVRDLGYAPRPFADGILAEARALGLAR